MPTNKVLLIILDGYGIAKAAKDNAILEANTPYIDQLYKNYPHTELHASGEYVGLPKGTVGGSEVGHFTIGCGQVLDQSLKRINDSIKDKSFFQHPLMQKQINKVQKAKGNIHITGLCSDAGIHADIRHLEAICDLMQDQKIKNFYFHAILDGRDVAQKSAKKYLQYINKLFQKKGIGTLASICGRFYAMDRDNNLDRTEQFYNLLTQRSNNPTYNYTDALKEAYLEVQSDYYIKPYQVHDYPSLQTNDLFININYRTDRQEQITQALENKDFQDFETPVKPLLLTFGDYGSCKFNLFPTPVIQENLSTSLAKNNKSQIRIAETEKFAHVTYFFNSQNKTKVKNEEHILINSLKTANYKDTPEMKAQEITQQALTSLKKNADLVVINYANPDLVGHSGDFTATKLAINTIDNTLQQLIPKYLEHNYHIIITADHGNAEDMALENSEPNPSHTSNKVPFLIVSQEDIKLRHDKDLSLADIAPTILELIQLESPKCFTGKSLIQK